MGTTGLLMSAQELGEFERRFGDVGRVTSPYQSKTGSSPSRTEYSDWPGCELEAQEGVIP